MLNSLSASFQSILANTMFELGAPQSTNFVYRDELVSKKPSPKKMNKDKEKTKKTMGLEKRSDGSDEGKGKGVMRVKIKMTKQEAARLMSKCKDGGILEFRDVAHELVKLPVDRVSVLPSSRSDFGSALQSIPEEI